MKKEKGRRTEILLVDRCGPVGDRCKKKNPSRISICFDWNLNLVITSLGNNILLRRMSNINRPYGCIHIWGKADQ